MAPLDMTALPDVSEAAPSGENLELDPDFGAMERAALGKPETQYGNTIDPAVPPDWKETSALAQSLMTRTHDLRVMTLLAIARLHLEGIPGFAAGMRTIRLQLETRWAQIHPQLDPEDDLDPTQRSNAVLRLEDPAKVLRPLRDTPLVSPPRMRPVSWRDIAVLNGAQEPEPGRTRMTEAEIVAAFAATEPDRLQALRTAMDGAVADVAAIPAAFDTHATPGSGPAYKDLGKLLRDIQKELNRFTEAATHAATPAPGPADTGAATPSEPSATAPRPGTSIQAILSLSKRDDALHALTLAASYFRTHEPSSPLPLLIDRARRLAGMEFLDILRDMAPDGLPQAQTIAGPAAE